MSRLIWRETKHCLWRWWFTQGHIPTACRVEIQTQASLALGEEKQSSEGGSCKMCWGQWVDLPVPAYKDAKGPEDDRALRRWGMDPENCQNLVQRLSRGQEHLPVSLRKVTSSGEVRRKGCKGQDLHNQWPRGRKTQVCSEGERGHFSPTHCLGTVMALVMAEVWMESDVVEDSWIQWSLKLWVRVQLWILVILSKP